MSKVIENNSVLIVSNGASTLDALVVNDGSLALEISEEVSWRQTRQSKNIYLKPDEATALKQFLIAQGF